MSKQMSFKLKKDSNSTKNPTKVEHSYEDEFSKLDFILMPYAFLLGSKIHHKVEERDYSPILYKLFSKNVKYSESAMQQINSFLEKEHTWFKKDPKKGLRGENNISLIRLKEILVSGALEIDIRHKSISGMKKRFRKRLPKSKPPLHFAKITRYINNGIDHEFWYEETGKEIAVLFPAFDAELIASLLAITSIRATVTSNATKFFKALDQFYKDETHEVPFGKRIDQKTIISHFKGFLDASLHHLNSLKNGVSLLDPSHREKNGRKIKNFAHAMCSGEDAIVDDVWITRAFNCDRKRGFRDRIISQSPTKAIYDATEWYLQTIANLVGKKARGLCAMIWVGIRQETTKETARYTDAIKKKLDHDLFAAQSGVLKPGKNGGIEFESH